MSMTHSCPLCGDCDWPDGKYCRRVEEAQAAGTLRPVCWDCKGTLHVEEREDPSGYSTTWLCNQCYAKRNSYPYCHE